MDLKLFVGFIIPDINGIFNILSISYDIIPLMLLCDNTHHYC